MRDYRLVIMREKTNDTQLGEKFNYRCILTNDHLLAEKEIIVYYNQRGSVYKCRVIDFVFLLRTSAIRASSIALCLASVPTARNL
jgi:hypothetical protein